MFDNIGEIKAVENKDDISFELWENLYQIISRMKALAPWKIFSEEDLAEIFLQGKTEPYYCSVQGMFDNDVGFSVYEGHAGLVNFSTYINSSDFPDYVAESRRSCLNCTFAEISRLTDKDLTLIKKIKSNFSDKEIPIFRNHRAGFAPWYFSEEDAETMYAAAREFVRAFSELTDNGVISDIDKGERICTKYDAEAGCWINELLSPVEKIEVMTESCIITDELLIRRLRKKRKNGVSLEFDMPYVPIAVEGGNPEKRPFYPRIAALCDAVTLESTDRYFVDLREDPKDTALGMIINYIEENGRPDEIFIRDAEIFGIIVNLCKEVDVPVHLTNSLRAVDFFMQEMIMMMNREE